MPLVSMTSLLDRARQGAYGVGYFEAWDGYSLEAVLEAAEEESAPVILGFGCMMAYSSWLDRGGIELLAGIGRAVAARARVPVALLLNEAQTYEQAVRGMEAGFNAVMLDTSAWPSPKALEAVARLTREAHARGVAVEAELGRLPDASEAGARAEPIHAPTAATLTDPDAAAEFVEQSGVDCLAVSIGNVHLLADGLAPVDMGRLEAIYRHVSVPLVIHGGSSFPPEAVPRAIACGVAKFNVGTVLKTTFLDAVQESMGRWDDRLNVHEILGSHGEGDFLLAGQWAMKAKVRELIRLYGGTDRAAE
jgi:ketose-bisphosphate aldolase